MLKLAPRNFQGLGQQPAHGNYNMQQGAAEMLDITWDCHILRLRKHRRIYIIYIVYIYIDIMLLYHVIHDTSFAQLKKQAVLAVLCSVSTVGCFEKKLTCQHCVFFLAFFSAWEALYQSRCSNLKCSPCLSMWLAGRNFGASLTSRLQLEPRKVNVQLCWQELSGLAAWQLSYAAGWLGCIARSPSVFHGDCVGFTSLSAKRQFFCNFKCLETVGMDTSLCCLTI